MRGAPRRGVHQSDLPLRLTIDETGRRCFGYLIVRNDGTVALASSRLFATEAAARVAGLPVLGRRSLAARLTPLKQQPS
jgi:hypothetical protein